MSKKMQVKVSYWNHSWKVLLELNNKHYEKVEKFSFKFKVTLVILFWHFSSLLKKEGRRKGEGLAKIVIKVIPFCSILKVDKIYTHITFFPELQKFWDEHAATPFTFFILYLLRKWKKTNQMIPSIMNCCINLHTYSCSNWIF